MKIILAFQCLLLGLTNLATAKEAQVLVLFHSDTGGTYELAKEVAQGIRENAGVNAVLKQVAPSRLPVLVDVPVATVEELPEYDGIAFGSPVYFGNISTAMSGFLSKTVDLWAKHALEGTPATVFMAAGSGAGREVAVQAFWNSLASHGMVLVPTGMRGTGELDKTIPQGNTILGTTSLNSLKSVPRPSEGERRTARLQGASFGKIALKLKDSTSDSTAAPNLTEKVDFLKDLAGKGITLPAAPKPVGNYTPFARAGSLVFINQVSLKDGAIVHPGKLGREVDEPQVKEATRLTMLNVIAVLNDATGGDLSRVKGCVQLTGIFNTPDDYSRHADLMNEASNLAVEVFGEKGKHARATLGASSLPVNSSVEIQAIFEIE